MLLAEMGRIGKTRLDGGPMSATYDMGHRVKRSKCGFLVKTQVQYLLGVEKYRYHRSVTRAQTLWR